MVLSYNITNLMLTWKKHRKLIARRQREENWISTETEKPMFGLNRKFKIGLKQHFKSKNQRYGISLTAYPLLSWYF